MATTYLTPPFFISIYLSIYLTCSVFCYIYCSIIASYCSLYGHIGGNPPDMAESGVCPYISVLMTLSAFLINVMGIGLMVNKMTQPSPKLNLSDKAIVKMRNGLLILQARCVSPYGHYVTDLQVKMVSFLQTTSLEGESYMEIKELKAECSHRGGGIPLNLTHEITRESALFGIDLENFNGWIEVIITGHDRFLGTKVEECMLYGTESIMVGYTFEDCFIKYPSKAASTNSPVEVNMRSFHRVECPESNKISVVRSALRAAKSERESKKERCLETGNEAIYYTSPNGSKLLHERLI